MIPNLFSKHRMPETIPEDMDRLIKKFAKGNNKELFLKKSFEYVVKRWHGLRINFLLKFYKLFYGGINKLWKQEGYMHCTNMTYVLRVMIVKSGLFKDQDIEIKLTTNYIIFLHEYLKIRVGKDKYIILDPWSYQYGIDYGDYAHGFKVKRFTPDINRLNGHLKIAQNL